MFLFASTQSVTTGRTPGANAPLGLLAAQRTLVSLRRAHLVRVAFVCTAPMQLLRCPSAASADGSGVDSDAADLQSTVMRGVLQVDKGVTWPSSIPRGSKAIVTMRVIGRNSKGPLATLALPIDAFPLDFTTIRKRLVDGASPLELRDAYLPEDLSVDLKLIWRNCAHFNGEDSWLASYARKTGKQAQDILDRFARTHAHLHNLREELQKDDWDLDEETRNFHKVRDSV